MYIAIITINCNSQITFLKSGGKLKDYISIHSIFISKHLFSKDKVEDLQIGFIANGFIANVHVIANGFITNVYVTLLVVTANLLATCGAIELGNGPHQH